MIAIALQFPAGRFHATPWGRHVNEGAPEWPPSPWRLLRSLVATWKGKLEAELSAGDAETILRTLAEPPEFQLPPAGTGHSRHYMPWFKKGPGDKTLVFDAFVALPRPRFDESGQIQNAEESELLCVWPDATLDSARRKLLSSLLAHLGYLGRAEAWCDARLLDDAEAERRTREMNCRPLGTRPPEAGTEIVRVLCAQPAEAFANGHFSRIEQKTSKAGAVTETLQRTAPVYDPDWHLCAETLWLRGARWSDPPGSRWVRYARRADCFRVAPRPAVRQRAAVRPQVARFALDSKVLPFVTHTLPVAEDARRNLMGIFGRRFQSAEGERANSPIFSGKDDNGVPGTTHGHAYHLPTDEDGDGRLDHITIVATDGFGPQELLVLDGLSEIKSREREESGHPLRVLLLALERLERCDFGPLRASREWISATPYLAPRFAKPRGTKRDPREVVHAPTLFLPLTLREELARLIARRPDLAGIDPALIEIRPLLDEQGQHFRLPADRGAGLRPIHFKRFRQKHGDDGGRRPAGVFRIVFPREVFGPIALGHSAHFGLGLFMPV